MGLSNRRREDHVRYHNDMLTHVEQAGAELVRKTVGSVLGDLTFCILKDDDVSFLRKFMPISR